MTRHNDLAPLIRGLLIAAFAFCLLAVFAVGQARAEAERIKSFIADITVEPNGDLLIEETITVHASGNQIKRGIFRDFPTIYPGPYGLNEKVDFELLEVRRDGVEEPYFDQWVDNGIRIYIGEESVLLPTGDYTYTIIYRTGRQLRFDEDFDELYWNVTGNGWAFPIVSAEARITLPEGANTIEQAAYTGRAGYKGGDYKVTDVGYNTITFATTTVLQPYQGFTVSVTWPKGYVHEPSGAARLGAMAGDNLGVIVGLIGLLLTLIYFLVFWNRVGRDPDKGVVIPLFNAPKGMSPVVTGYAWSWGFRRNFSRNRAFAVALTSMATKGAITIDEHDDDSFTLRRETDTPQGLAPGEQVVFDKLFDSSTAEVTLSQTYDSDVRRAVVGLQDLIRDEYANVYVRMNRAPWAGGLLLAIISAVTAAVVGAQSPDNLILAGFLSLFGLAFGFASAFVWVMIGPRLAVQLRRPSRKLLTTLLSGVAALLFSGPALASLGFAAQLLTLPVFIIMVANAVIVVVFWFLLRAPTMHGREVMDAIEGYRLYLSVAESDRMNMLGAEPVMSIELFERHLAYAMALGVEEKWTEHFEAQIPADQTQQGPYSPRWYSSSRGVSNLSSMASTLSSGLSSTISSAATRPSSSSSGGSSGGGSSGGGGGGGGGGGW